MFFNIIAIGLLAGANGLHEKTADAKLSKLPINDIILRHLQDEELPKVEDVVLPKTVKEDKVELRSSHRMKMFYISLVLCIFKLLTVALGVILYFVLPLKGEYFDLTPINGDDFQTQYEYTAEVEKQMAVVVYKKQIHILALGGAGAGLYGLIMLIVRGFYAKTYPKVIAFTKNEVTKKKLYGVNWGMYGMTLLSGIGVAVSAAFGQVEVAIVMGLLAGLASVGSVVLNAIICSCLPPSKSTDEIRS